MDTPDTEQYKCKSYYNDKQELCDCSCGKCGIGEIVESLLEELSYGGRKNLLDDTMGMDTAREILRTAISSRDTYWKERVRKEVEKALTVVKLRIVYDRRQGTPAEETLQDIYDSIELKLTPITNEDTPTET